jgi:hypothetical protein
MLRGLVARAGFDALAAAASAGCGSARPDGLWSRAGQGVVIVEPVLQRLEHQRLSPDRWENPNSFNGPATRHFLHDRYENSIEGEDIRGRHAPDRQSLPRKLKLE